MKRIHKSNRRKTDRETQIKTDRRPERQNIMTDRKADRKKYREEKDGNK